uniref:acylglycerol lipase n=1 Tax=Eptatretus burgeri TaxID=7764 RepID=A0A8C4NDF8_EPTBU
MESVYERALAVSLDPMMLSLAIPLLVFAYYWFFQPSAFLYFHNWYWRTQLGLQVYTVRDGSYNFCYSELGRPSTRPSLLFLHAFSANKDMWLPMLRYLPKSLHIICVDLPGHEGTTRLQTDDYSLQGQAGRVHQFVQALELHRKFHVIGMSMGGGVAGVYAATYPEHICGLTLICPAGLCSAQDSCFVKELRSREGGIPGPISLIPESPEEVRRMLELCTFRFKLPQQILQGMVDVRKDHNGFYLQLLLALSSECSRYRLQEVMEAIAVPTQVIWGLHDQVLDVSAVEELKWGVRNCRVDLLENCGHTVTLERPRKSANLIASFLRSLGTLPA